MPIPVPLIGVFWLRKGKVFGHAAGLDQGEEGINGLLDSHHNHVDIWERLALGAINGFDNMEYFEIPRGRVLYSRANQKSIVYMDSVLFVDAAKAKIADFFKLDVQATSWLRDSHYTTKPSDLNVLFGNSDT